MKRIAQLGAASGVSEHPQRLLARLARCAQTAGIGGPEQLVIRDGIPQAKREPCSDGVVIRLAKVGVEEARRLERKQHDFLDRVGGRLSLGKTRVDEELLLLRGEWAAKGPLDKPVAKRVHLGVALRVIRGRTGQGVNPVGHEVGHLDGGERGGFIPLFGDGRAALVAGATVVRGEGLAQNERVPSAGWGEAAGRDDLPGSVRRVPLQFDRGAAAFVLKKIEAQRVGTTADEPQRAGEFPGLTA